MKALVTGGGGYLGKAIVRLLLSRGDQVVSLQRGDYPELTRMGVEIYTGDVADPEVVIRASRDCELVFHVAGKTGVWGEYRDYYHTNVKGTESVIEACRINGIKRLVYTSTPSVVFDGNDEDGIDESMPYPAHFFNHYQSTKAEAEQIVLAANNDQLATISLRPHLIWGPGDPHLIERIIARARKGRLRLINSNNLVDTTYIENAASAHLAAADSLGLNKKCAGRAYFISNGEPVIMNEIINRILIAHKMAPVSKMISPGMAYTAGVIYEVMYKLLGIKQEPLMTRFIARQLSCAHWYNISAARNDLGYEPGISVAEGLDRLNPK